MYLCMSTCGFVGVCVCVCMCVVEVDIFNGTGADVAEVVDDGSDHDLADLPDVDVAEVLDDDPDDDLADLPDVDCTAHAESCERSKHTDRADGPA